MIKRFRQIGLLFFILVTFASCDPLPTRDHASVGQYDPSGVHDFTLSTLVASESVSLSEFLGKDPVLLAFFATWCPPCVEEVPQLNRMEELYAKRGLKVIAVDVGESAEKVSRFAERHKIGYTVALDRDGVVAEAYQIIGLPTAILVDREGKVRFRGFTLPKYVESVLE